jgi:hypothetical protein
MQFVDVPSKTVEFEDGQTAIVAGFRVSEYCVTIREFLEFQKATGYVSPAEREGGRDFRANELVEHTSEDKRLDETAFCLSSLDASQFCDWANLRLPSEIEWLAAAMVDERIYDRNARETLPFRDANGVFDVAELKGHPKAGQCEFTSTRTRAGLVVVRAGPWYYRESDWREYARDHRRLVSPDKWDLFFCFRVATLGTIG